MPPLTQELVDQLFSFMEALGFTTYTMDIGYNAMGTLLFEVTNLPGIQFSSTATCTTVSVPREGRTIDFVYKKI